MADIQIERTHTLGLCEARKVSVQWAARAKEKYNLTCTYQEGQSSDLLSFSRPGVSGTLTVSADRLELTARLGFLLSVFHEKIEGEVARKLDQLIARSAGALACGDQA